MDGLTREIDITIEKCDKIKNFLEETEAEMSRQSLLPIQYRNISNHYSKPLGFMGEGSLNMSTTSRRESLMVNDQAKQEKVCCLIM